MPWYMWALIYMIGWMVTFRTVYLKMREATQRAHVDRWRKENRDMEDVMKSVAAAFGWPFVIIFLLGRVIMFPRGIKTKFDQEQQLLTEKDEAEIKYREAKALLAKEGIKVE